MRFPDPQWKIGVLNIMSLISAYLLNQLVKSLFEQIRWKVVSRPGGVLWVDFDALSSSTGFFGCLNRLFCWKARNETAGNETAIRIVWDKRQKWNMSKYFAPDLL